MSHKADKRTTYKREFGAVDYVHEYDLDIEKRDIFLFGREEYRDHDTFAEPGVEFMMANRLIKNLRILQSISSDPILIHMKTNGGFWEEGMAIYQAIEACPNYVVILNYTHARSMSSIILQAGDHRVMMPYSVFMFHDGTVDMSGTVKQFWTEADQLKASQELMLDIYLNQMENAKHWQGKARSKIKRWMRDRMDRKEEVYLTAEETVELGLADAVFGKDGKYDWNALRNG